MVAGIVSTLSVLRPSHAHVRPLLAQGDTVIQIRSLLGKYPHTVTAGNNTLLRTDTCICGNFRQFEAGSNWKPIMPRAQTPAIAATDTAEICEYLDGRHIVLIGLMGAGKTSVGRRLAACLNLPFTDADTEIEIAAGKTIPEIFADHGEEHFRQGECRVIERLLNDAQQVLATGGGAYMNELTRENIAKHGVCVWLRAELPLLMKRVSRRSNRPLLINADPEQTMKNLMAERHPVYAGADIVVDSRDEPHDVIVADIIDALNGLARNQ